MITFDFGTSIPLYRRHKQQHIRSADASPARQIQEDDLQQSEQFKTPENIQVKQKSQPTHYNGAFIGVQGDFKSALKQKRKSSNNLSLERKSMEMGNSSNLGESYSREQNFMSVFNPNEDQTLKGRRALMGRLGFNNTGISSSVYQKRYINNQSEIRDEIGTMKKKSESSNNILMQDTLTDSRIKDSDIQQHFGLQIKEKQQLDQSSEASDKQDQIVETFVSPESDGFALDFIQKDRTIDRMRRQYLSKLTYQKVWLTQQEKPKFHETVIIFDWDDTLMCTTFINPSGYKEKYDLNGPIAEQLRTLEKVALKILTLSIAHGKTFIITNAAEGWVEYSADRYLPSLVPLLQHITVISARSRYEPHFPDDFTKWKLYAFQETQGLIDEAMITNIIALGDSMMEMDAAHQLGERFSKALIKTVKFREMPKPNELVKQLNLVIMKFQEILNSPKNLTIRLEKKTQQAAN